ncbi:MAG: hypothetical protein QM784_22065 [Polyangiaceae bacterium]
MTSLDDFVPCRKSLGRLLDVACAEYSAPEQRRQIRQYIWELAQLMTIDTEPPDDASSKRAEATRDATGEDVVSPLCKFEDYLESLMVGEAAKRIGG